MIFYLQDLNPIVCLAINVAVQISCVRWVPGVGLLKSVFWGFGAGLCALIGFEFFIESMRLDSASGANIFIVVNSLTYSALGYCYFHFINLGETARRIRMLRELDDAGGSLTKQELLQRYNAKEIVTQRLGRMLRHGQIVERDGNYFVGKPTLLTIARIIVAMKKLLLGKTSEFN